MNFDTLDAQARDILRLNDKGGYTIPTAGLYPYQWNWDSAFAAWGFAQFDPARAWLELETLMSGQWPSGMVPHILFHVADPGYFPGPDVWGTKGIGPIHSSGITQPPVAATIVRTLFEMDPVAHRAKIKALFSKLHAWHAWFMAWRCQDDMIFVTHPWEAGRDNTPDWDEAMAAIDPVGVGEYTRRDTSHVDASMRPTKDDYDRYIFMVQHGKKHGWIESALDADPVFRVADPTMHFILLRAQRDLAALAEKLGEDRSDIDAWIAQLEAGAARLRGDDGMFGAINLLTGRPTQHLTSASFLNWYAGIEDAEMMRALKQTLQDCAFPVPSHDVNAPEFDGKRYWRGPTWAILNAMIGRGLTDMGHTEVAEDLRQRSAQMIAKHGFAEYFHPITGAPAGGGTFTWTAAVWLSWATPTLGAE